jgi:hypothetical protein
VQADEGGQNVEFHGFYSSSDIPGEIKCQKMRWEENVTLAAGKRCI